MFPAEPYYDKTADNMTRFCSKAEVQAAELSEVEEVKAKNTRKGPKNW